MESQLPKFSDITYFLFSFMVDHQSHQIENSMNSVSVFYFLFREIVWDIVSVN